MATPLSARSPCREPVGDGAYFCSHPHHRQIRQLGKTEKCSNIENVAPDPGSCTRVMYATARQGPDFFIIFGSVGQDAENRRNGDSARKTISPPRPAQRHLRPPASARRAAGHPDRNTPPRENRYETHYLRHLD